VSSLFNNFNRNSSFVKDYNASIIKDYDPNTFVENEVYATDIFVKQDRLQEPTFTELTCSEPAITEPMFAAAKQPEQPERTGLHTSMKLPNRISSQQLHKYVLGLVGVFALFLVAYPIAMNRVSHKEKFAPYQSYVKSLTPEYKPTNPSL
jgi:hypothetical protein